MEQEFSLRANVALNHELVWELVHDYQLLADCSSSVGQLSKVDADLKWKTSLSSQLGPFQISAPLVVEILEDDRESGNLVIVAQGEDKTVGTRLLIRANATIQPDSATAGAIVSLNGAYEVSGKVANLGSGLVKRHADRMLTEFWWNLLKVMDRRATQV